MIEKNAENGKSNVCQNDDFGAAGVCHKIPDQVGDDRKVKCSGMVENIGSAGMTGRNAGTYSNPSFLGVSSSSFSGLSRESVGDKKIPAFAGMTDGVKRTGMTERNAGTSSNSSFLGLTRESVDIRSESGKSMVEMLGVLALMGLLAILGVKGYELAMERVAANNIINEVNRRSVIYSQQLMAGDSSTDLNSSELADEIQGGFAIAGYRYGLLYFKIDVQNVPQAVCQHIGKNGYPKAISLQANNVEIGPTTQASCKEGSNTISFTFTKELSPCQNCLENLKLCSGTGTGTCSANELCQNNMCVCAPQYVCGTSCCSEGQTCVNGKCQAGDSCGDGICEQGVCENGSCVCSSWQDNCWYFCMMSNKSTGTCSTNPYLAQGADTNAGGVVWSSRTLNWYAAKDFCESDYNGNKSMVTFEELGCVKLDGVQNWDCSGLKAEYRGKDNVWVADQWKNNNEAWYVNTSSGAVGSVVWSHVGNVYALCR